jgi:hypothetical protein
MLGLVEEIDHVGQALIEKAGEGEPGLPPEVDSRFVYCGFSRHNFSLLVHDLTRSAQP